ncbi:MAG: DUF1934 domain-containing protein [Eubacteriales bacterium]|nr:DUF1934 domain-containing protein [Eubacteriales bacterium]
MTQKVIISLTGFQFMQGEDDTEPVEVISTGEYYFRGGKHYVLYDELTEGFDEPTHNFIKFNDSRLSVRKKGLLNVEMIFEKDKHTNALYMTPMGGMDLGISATDFRLTESEDRIELHVDYSMTIEEEYTADCQIDMVICSKIDGNFSLKRA